MVPFERAMVVFYRLAIVIIALSLMIRPLFTVDCLQCSSQQGGEGQFGSKFSEEEVTNASQILTLSWRDMRLLYIKYISCHMSKMHERGRQTDRQTTER